jgi:hypothetical protein
MVLTLLDEGHFTAKKAVIIPGRNATIEEEAHGWSFFGGRLWISTRLSRSPVSIVLVRETADAGTVGNDGVSTIGMSPNGGPVPGWAWTPDNGSAACGREVIDVLPNGAVIWRRIGREDLVTHRCNARSWASWAKSIGAKPCRPEDIRF